MREKNIIIFLVLFSAALFIFGLGRTPLTDPDESFYAETAREMLARNEYLTPYIFGKPQFEKPPLYYWLVETSFRAFGVNEFSARIPSALFGILGVIACYFLARLLFGVRCALLSSLALASSLEYIILSRACVTDMAFSTFILCAFLLFLHAYRTGADRRLKYCVSAVFLGLAVLTKGPVGILLPGLVIFIYMLAVREIKRIREFPLVSGLIIFLLVAAPWYILAYKTHGSAFVDEFLGFHNVTRFLHPEHVEGSQFYYNIPVFFGTFFPWSIFFPFALWALFRRREDDARARQNYIFLLVWILVIFVFFTVSRTKLPTYIFPLYPAAAIFVGRLWDVFLERTDDIKVRRPVTFCFWVLLISSLAAFFAGYAVINRKYPTVIDAAAWTGLTFAAGIILSFIVYTRRKYFASFLCVCFTFIVTIVPLTYVTMPEAARYVTSKEFAQEVLKRALPGDKTGAETDYVRGMAFYTRNEDIIDVHRHHIITKLLDEPGRIWCVIKDKNHVQLYTDEKAPFKSPTYIVYKFGKKVLMTNKVPPDGKYLKKRTFDDPF